MVPMFKYLALILIPLFSGCACIDCFTDDVTRLSKSEYRSTRGGRNDAFQMVKDEFSHFKDLKTDISNQFSFGSIEPRTYINDIKDILCPSD